MDILILGGTVFVGRHLVEAALVRGHRVTLFHRGQHGTDLFPEAEHLLGDRNESLNLLRGRRWDAVIDTSGFFPRQVKATAEALADAVGHYTFISSASVYGDPSVPGMDERAPVGTLADPMVEKRTGETYGPLKALCEGAVEAALPGRVLIVRPGLIVGPHDPTNRFAYWPRRLAAGGAVLAPGSPSDPVQIIDARDLAAWIILSIKAGRTGVYNALGPDYALTMGEVLAACQAAGNADARIHWVAEDFLLAHEVQPWSELPLWIPTGDASMAGFRRMSSARAQAAGLIFRPLTATVQDTLAWDAAQPPLGPNDPPRATLTPEREATLLQEWQAQDSSLNAE